jgi:hypothetical protein
MAKIRIETRRGAADFIKCLPDGKTVIECDAKSIRILRAVAFEYSKQAMDKGLSERSAALITTEAEADTYAVLINPHERFEMQMDAHEEKDSIRQRMEALKEGESMLVECAPELVPYVRHLAYSVLKGYAVSLTYGGCNVTKKQPEKSKREAVFELLDGYAGKQIEITDVAYTNVRSYVSQYNKDRLTDFGVRKTEGGCVVFVTGELPSELYELYVTVRDKAPIDSAKFRKLNEFMEKMRSELEALMDG